MYSTLKIFLPQFSLDFFNRRVLSKLPPSPFLRAWFNSRQSVSQMFQLKIKIAGIMLFFFKRSLVCLLLTVSLEYTQQVHFSYFTLAFSTNSGFNCTNTLIAWMKLRPVLRRQVFLRVFHRLHIQQFTIIRPIRDSLLS